MSGDPRDRVADRASRYCESGELVCYLATSWTPDLVSSVTADLTTSCTSTKRRALPRRSWWTASSTVHKDLGDSLLTPSELCFMFGNLPRPLCGRVGHVNASDGVGGDVPAADPQRHHWQRERHDDLAG